MDGVFDLVGANHDLDHAAAHLRSALEVSSCLMMLFSQYRPVAQHLFLDCRCGI